MAQLIAEPSSGGNERVKRYLLSFHPICSTRLGRDAIQRYGLAPFIDGSCRREPDLELAHPSISALCRNRRFAPRLRAGDSIAYITTLDRYGELERHWRLVALLEVLQSFETHEAAAVWYRDREPRLPSNCMVPGNPPLPLSKTCGPGDADLRKAMSKVPDAEVVAEWDRRYGDRMRNTPVFVACSPVMVSLHDPPRIFRSDWLAWHGKVPGTQSYLSPPDSLWRELCLRTAVVPRERPAT